MLQLPFRVGYFCVSLFTSTIALLGIGHAAEFFCPTGNVTCLIASINEANGDPGEHTITLEPGAYSLHAESSLDSGLPVITSSIRIQPSAEEVATVIVRDAAAAGSFRIFTVALGARLNLVGITVLRSHSASSRGVAGGRLHGPGSGRRDDRRR